MVNTCPVVLIYIVIYSICVTLEILIVDIVLKGSTVAVGEYLLVGGFDIDKVDDVVDSSVNFVGFDTDLCVVDNVVDVGNDIVDVCVVDFVDVVVIPVDAVDTVVDNVVIVDVIVSMVDVVDVGVDVVINDDMDAGLLLPVVFIVIMESLHTFVVSGISVPKQRTGNLVEHGVILLSLLTLLDPHS